MGGITQPIRTALVDQVVQAAADSQSARDAALAALADTMTEHAAALTDIANDRAAALAAIDADEASAIGTIALMIDAAAGIFASVFQTRTAAVAFHIAPAVNTIITGGFAAYGDLGGARYKRDVSLTLGGFQSADGAYWSLAEKVVCPQMFGDMTAADSTATAQTFLDYIGAFSGQGYWPGGTYTLGRILPSSYTTLYLSPLAVLNLISGGIAIFRLTDLLHVSIISDGAKLDGRLLTSSSIVYLAGCSHITVQGLRVFNSTAGKDCIYVGKSSLADYCTDVNIEGNELANGNRNGISIAACDGFLIRRNEIYGAVAAPGCGIDCEANTYSNLIRRGKITENNIHNNGNSGVDIAFADDIILERNWVHDNTQYGITGGAGGAQLDVGVRRANTDIYAITAMNNATGEIQVSNGANLRRGMIMLMFSRGDGVKPTEWSVTRYMVWSKDVTGNWFKVSKNGSSAQLINSYAVGYTGTPNADPELSALYCEVYAEGNCSNIQVRHNYLANNGSGDISFVTSVGVWIEGNRVEPAANQTAINVIYCRKGRVKDNYVKSSGGTAGEGIHLAFSSFFEEEGNRVEGQAGYGINISGLMDSRWGQRSHVLNSGLSASPTAAVSITNTDSGICGNIICRADPDKNTTYGIYTNGWLTPLIIGADVTGCGASNANGIGITGTTPSIPLINVTRWDGILINDRGGNLEGLTIVNSNAALGLTPRTSTIDQEDQSAITTSRAFTPSTTGAIAGLTRFRITRQGSGNFQRPIGTTGHALGVGEWADVRWDGVAYYVAERGKITNPAQTVSTNADATLTPHGDCENILHTGTLTAARTLTFATTNANAGDVFSIRRTGTGNFQLILGTTGHALCTGEWAGVRYDGTTWNVVERGVLTAPTQTLSTDADTALTPHANPRTIVHTGALTLDRTLTLGTTNALAGDTFTIDRTGSGSFQLIINNNGSGVIAALGSGEWARCTFDGTNWLLIERGKLTEGTATYGDVAVTLNPHAHPAKAVFNTPLTANRAVTLGTTNAIAGDRFRIVRTAAASGAFTLDVGTGPLKSMPLGSWAVFYYTGAAWELEMYGTL